MSDYPPRFGPDYGKVRRFDPMATDVLVTGRIMDPPAFAVERSAVDRLRLALAKPGRMTRAEFVAKITANAKGQG